MSAKNTETAKPAAKPASETTANDAKKSGEGTPNDASETKAKGAKDASAPAASRKPASASKGTEQVSLPKGKGTQNTESIGGPAPIPRGEGSEQDPGVTDGKKDTIRRQADKARWEYGKNDTDTATLLKEQQEIDRNNK